MSDTLSGQSLQGLPEASPHPIGIGGRSDREVRRARAAHDRQLGLNLTDEEGFYCRVVSGVGAGPDVRLELVEVPEVGHLLLEHPP